MLLATAKAGDDKRTRQRERLCWRLGTTLVTIRAWQRKKKAAARADLAFHPDPSSVRLDNAFGDR